ncbi:GLPGLI family protein [Flavobacteriaceae bacterium S356]|uniref:GLPGLI family protein n=1 Tax=Asprobacillus argus TaxID=3076534 RepID=A0ABU3LAU1_9FLAO|nr:GLPGLI family protein [Flavobacteriaceae bacterium S356]
MRVLLAGIALMLSVALSAQGFSGKAIYKTYRKSNVKIGGQGQNGVTPEMEKQLQERMKKMFQKTFVLNFNKTESTYKEDVKLSSPAPQPGGGGMMVMSFGGGGGNDLLYKNIKENRFANKTDLMGKLFLVKDSLIQYDWKMTGETKNIGNYTCYKAIYEREQENISMSMIDGEMKESKKMETITTTAWYTPDVPINNGPGNYWGLPGLILEINDGRLTIACTEIVLNPAEKIEIIEPTKGKKVNSEKFEEISRKKSKEMMERFRSKRGDGNGIEIRIGG